MDIPSNILDRTIVALTNIVYHSIGSLANSRKSLDYAPQLTKPKIQIIEN